MWQPALPRALSATVAGTVLSELTPGGALMPGHNRQQLHRTCTLCSYPVSIISSAVFGVALSQMIR